jgi:hypothetical protein
MRSILAACALAAACLGTPSQAALIQADLLAPGDGLLTVDTDSGLEWLAVWPSFWSRSNRQLAVS